MYTLGTHFNFSLSVIFYSSGRADKYQYTTVIFFDRGLKCSTCRISDSTHLESRIYSSVVRVFKISFFLRQKSRVARYRGHFFEEVKHHDRLQYTQVFFSAGVKIHAFSVIVSYSVGPDSLGTLG